MPALELLEARCMLAVVTIDTDALTIVGDDANANTFYGTPFTAAIESSTHGSVARFRVHGNLTVPADQIVATGSNMLSIIVGNNVTIAAGASIDASASGTVPGPGGASSGSGGFEFGSGGLGGGALSPLTCNHFGSISGSGGCGGLGGSFNGGDTSDPGGPGVGGREGFAGSSGQAGTSGAIIANSSVSAVGGGSGGGGGFVAFNGGTGGAAGAAVSGPSTENTNGNAGDIGLPGTAGSEGNIGTRGSGGQGGGHGGSGIAIAGGNGGGGGGQGGGGQGGGQGGGGGGGSGGSAGTGDDGPQVRVGGTGGTGGEGGDGGPGGNAGNGGPGSAGGAGAGAVEIIAHGRVTLGATISAYGGAGANGLGPSPHSLGDTGEAGDMGQPGFAGSNGAGSGGEGGFGGSGADGDDGGSGGGGGGGGGGAGGTVKVVGTIVNANGSTMDTRGGAGGSGHIAGVGTVGDGASGANGRLVFGHNMGNAFNGTLNNGTLVNMTDGGANVGSRTATPFVASDQVPLIPDLPDGAEGYGQVNMDADQLLSSVTFANSPHGAAAAIIRLDKGTLGLDADFPNFDLLLYVGLADSGVDDPQFGVSSRLERLRIGGFANDPDFGGGGDELIDHFERREVYVILFRSDATSFQASATMDGKFFFNTNIPLNNGQGYYLNATGSSDFGDASDPTYPTLAAQFGAQHLLGSGLVLGTVADADSDGQPNANATGDDVASTPDDEDGVVFVSNLVKGQVGSVTVTASTAGQLNAWIDFNNNGSWADVGEQIFTNRSLAAGVNNLTFAISANATTGVSLPARFRLNSSGGLSFTGLAADGEVEDHLITIQALTKDKIGIHRGFQFYQDVNDNGVWNNAAGGDRLNSFGASGDTPLVGDWNGDGLDEIGVKRGNQYYWDVNGSGTWNGVAGGDRLFNFGNPADKPIVGDWDGDGDDEIGVQRGNQFYLDKNGNGVWNGAAGGDLFFTFGNPGDTPLAGDWDGDGDDQIGVHRGSHFYLDRNGNAIWNNVAGGDRLFNFGASGDTPITGDWNADGVDEIGVHRSNVFYRDKNGNGIWNGNAGGDLQQAFGNPGDRPIDGKWRPVGALLAAGDAAASPSDAAPLTRDALAPILQQAIILWANTGLSSSQLHTLHSVQVAIADLPGAQLGLSLGGTILIDRDAAGYGWFIDPTPDDNSEFDSAVPLSAFGVPHSMDLLSVVMHELGHELGFDHDDDLAAMFETLAVGTRRLL